MSNPHRGPGARMGLTRGFDLLSLPHMGHLIFDFIKSPSLPHYYPRGGGVVV